MKFNRNIKFVVIAIALLAITIGILFPMLSPWNANGYTDVNNEDWYYPVVQYMAEKGYMTGYSATTFGPKDTLSRAMFVTILYRVSGEKVQTSTTKFVDVPTNTWYSEAIAWAVANGITSGTSDTTFSPNAPVTREQMATLMQRYANSKGIDLGNKYIVGQPNDLANSNTWGRDGILYGYEYGLLFATNGNVYPTNNATRADAAVAFYNFVNKDNWVTPTGRVCNHNWATRHVDEVGHYEESTNTHIVEAKVCFICNICFRSDDPDFQKKWEEHMYSDETWGHNWTNQRIEVLNDPQYVVDIPAHDEVYCIVCGYIK